MINPLDYGHQISNKRHTIKEVQLTKKPIDSFEIGKNGSGFRFLYPITKLGKFLGTVSITFSELAITSSMMKQYNTLCNIIIKDANFDKDFLENSDLYKEAHFEGFLHNTDVINELEKVAKKRLFEIKPALKTSRILYTQGMQNIPYSLFIENQDVVVTTIPVTNRITNKQEAFISILTKARAIAILNSNYYTILALFIFLYLAIILLFLQQKIKTLVEKETLEQIMLKDKQILEQAKMAQMGEMIGNIAHQWRQPLSAISTVASGVKLNYEYNLLNEKDIPKNMDLIVKNVKYLSETIDTFRDFIREDKVKKEVLVQEKIDECLKILSASIENAHIDLIKDVDYDNPVLIKMKSEELTQVIINLINNSKDAILQNDVNEGWIKISQKSLEDQLIIKVEDNGKGIRKDILTKIFDPYFTTKHQFQGTGLGLYMSKTIIEKYLKGKLEVKNTQSGAEFTIILKIPTRN